MRKFHVNVDISCELAKPQILKQRKRWNRPSPWRMASTVYVCMDKCSDTQSVVKQLYYSGDSPLRLLTTILLTNL